jgi:hypothetical protein
LITEALSISRAAMEFAPDPEEKEKQAARSNSDEDFLFSRLEPSPRLRTHDYKTILNEGVRAIVEFQPFQALKLTCEILNEAINLSHWKEELSKRDGNDGSYSWRPAIEEHGQNTDYRAKELLVPIIRDSAVRCLQSQANTFGEVEKVLLQYPWDVFTRIYIHLCRTFAVTAGGQRILSLLTDHKFFNNYRFKHEWSLLLAEQFKNLSDADKNIILGWCDNEFDEQSRVAHYKQMTGKEPTDDLVRGWKMQWQRDILYFIANDLPDERKKAYELVVAEFGQPQHPDFAIWSSGVMNGAISPKTTEQLLAMPIQDLLNYLKDWQPSERPFENSVDGLAAALQLAVKSEPERFVSVLHEFRNLRTSYVTVVIRGLNEAAAEGKEVVWKPLLELCIWVLHESSANEAAKPKEEDRDEWQWTRMEIIRLISNGLKRENNVLPFEFRDLVWKLLSILVEDRVPTIEYEQKYLNGRQYGTLSINTNRGEAIHALFDYANWVRKHTNAANNANPATEILEPLTAHLDPEKEPTFTIRSVYSQHLGWLYYFHPDWVESHLSKIFPKDKKLEKYYDAAWQTYVIYCSAWVPLFKLLTEQYELAVANIAKDKGDKNDFDLQHPDDALAQHLIALYWWGELSIDDPNSLLSKFFAKAPVAVRKHAIEFAGRSVWNTEGEVLPEVLSRLQHLFDVRLQAAEASQNPRSFVKELSAFGPWVYSKRFDDEWTLKSLERTLTLTQSHTRLSGYILERLSELSARYPLSAVKCLMLIVRTGDQQSGWHFETDKIKRILSNAMKSDDEQARQIATEAKDSLLRSGMFVFRTLD